MIISASRRTDIPAYYSEWFFHRLREGYVLTQNPRNPRQIKRISLTPESVDGIVFWTKNPLPMLDRLGELDSFPYYFQFTLNSYGKDAEPGLPSKNDVLLPAFQRLSKQIGRDRVVWRYDPIFLTPHYTLEYHCRYFRVMASRLSGYTETCTVSFLDFYRNTASRTAPLQLLPMTEEAQIKILTSFSETAKEYGISLNMCAEPISKQLGIPSASCIDASRLERISGRRLPAERDKNQRPMCGCAASVDIGMYDCCANGCLYCYANSGPAAVARRMQLHDPKSPFLLSKAKP